MTEGTENIINWKGAKINTKNITREKIEEAKKKCLQVVENLLEPSVPDDLLVSLCVFLSQDDYLDLVEERNILFLCGYPLCSKAVKPIKQKYHISVKSNKVYDITERKCFCSNVCYKASNFLKAQLCACPVWLEEKDAEDKSITLLGNTENSGSAGEEVDLGHKRMTADDIEWTPDKESSSENIYSPYTSDDLEARTAMLEKLEISEECMKSQNTDSTERTLLTSEEKDKDGGDVMSAPKPNADCIHVITEKYMEQSNSTKQPITQYPYLDSDDDDYSGLSVEHTKYESLISNNKYMPMIPKKTIRKTLLIEPVGNPDGMLRSPLDTEKINNSLRHIQNALLSWISINTFQIILGEKNFELLKHEILENAEAPVPKLEANSFEKLEAVKQTYAKICLKLEKEEAVELNSSDGSNEKGDLSHEIEGKLLCENKEDLDKFKVSMFYKGSIGFPDAPASKKKAVKKSKPAPRKNIKKEPSAKSIRANKTGPITPSTSRDISVLPVVESVSQSVIRRQIVADRLKIVYLNMLPLVGLHYRDISDDFRVLISTFSLSSRNISFKPPEWKMIAVILFRMVEKKLTTEKVWNQEKCWELLKAKLISFDISLDQIDTLLASVTDHSRLKALLLGN